MTDATLRLSLIQEHRILDQAAGLNEPSGLTLNHDGTAPYTVSDDTKAVFQLDLKGRLSIAESFFIGVDDLEGIAINADGSRLHAVQEETNAVITIDIASRRELSRRPLAAMANYASIARYIPDPPDNKGLEGITVNNRTGHLLVVKEGRPGLLIELDGEGNRILEARLLNDRNGFVHPSVGRRNSTFPASATTPNATRSGSPATKGNAFITTTGSRTGCYSASIWWSKTTTSPCGSVSRKGWRSIPPVNGCMW